MLFLPSHQGNGIWVESEMWEIPFEGVAVNVERRYRETNSDFLQENNAPIYDRGIFL